MLNGDPIIAYCRIGERSAHTWFVLHELLGKEDVKNYDGSWTEWGNLVDVPIETMRLPIMLAALLAVGLATVAFADDRGVPHGRSHEIWAVDQSNTTGTTSGGALYVYDGRGLSAGSGPRAERIDLGGAATAMCMAQTGTAPVRPHMLLFNRRGSHAILSFVASGHVLFLDARNRTPLACIDVGAQAHAAVPAPDESYVIVANQNGKLVQRIRTDYRTNTFALEPDATLDLVPHDRPPQDPRCVPITRRSAR